MNPFDGHFLFDQLLGENGQQLLPGDGFPGDGVQRRQRPVGHVGYDVVPLGGHLTLGQAEFLRFHLSWIFKGFVQKKSPLFTFVNNGLVARDSC